MEESKVRLYINAFSRERGGHPYTDYGDHVTFITNDDVPYYRCRVQTQFENREASVKTRPYDGRPLPARKYFSLRDIGVWSYQCTAPNEFTDGNTDLTVTGSSSVEKCSRCQGNGRSTCVACQGKGEEKCPSCGGNWNRMCGICDGYGEYTCGKCGGWGKMSCPKCGGAGSYKEKHSEWVTHYDYNLKRQVGGYEWVDKDITCSVCHGQRKVTCSECNGHKKIKCYDCHGNGYITCSKCEKGSVKCKACSGKRYITCPPCEGKGDIESRYVIKRTLAHNDENMTLCDPRVKDFANKKSLTLTSVFHKRQSSLENDLYPQQRQCREALQQLLARARRGHDGRILFEEADVWRADMTYVKYSLSGNTYSGVIHADRFYPLQGDPVSQWYNQLEQNIRSAINHDRLRKASRLICQAEDNGCDAGTVRSLRHNLRGRAEDHALAGLNFSFWAALLLLSPLIYLFYLKFNPVASWAIVTNNPHWLFTPYVPLTQTLLFVALAILVRHVLQDFLEPPRKRHYPGRVFYFAKGYLLYLLFLLVGTALLMGLNYLGLSMVTTFLVGFLIVVVKDLFWILKGIVKLLWKLVLWVIHLF